MLWHHFPSCVLIELGADNATWDGVGAIFCYLLRWGQLFVRPVIPPEQLTSNRSLDHLLLQTGSCYLFCTPLNAVGLTGAFKWSVAHLQAPGLNIIFTQTQTSEQTRQINATLCFFSNQLIPEGLQTPHQRKEPLFSCGSTIFLVVLL